MMEYGNMLAVVGSPSSGKTTISIKLAVEIAKKKKNVIVVCADPFAPPVPFLLTADTEQNTSLGALLTAPTLTQNKILEACVLVPSSEHISLLGYCLGENPMSYPKVTRERVIDFLVSLRHLADYVILDCTAVFEADIFSILAMELADRVLRMGTSNLRGISYYRSHAGMLEDRKDGGKYISAIGNFKTGQEWEAAAGHYGGVSFVFPYVLELEAQYDELHLFEGLTSKESSAFQMEIRKLMTEISGLQVHIQEQKPEVKRTVTARKKSSFQNPFAGRKGEF
ncbi:AAA domain-containing protein [Kineothrix alysoides]|uniref:AAA domain-containing protein n=1 Tax=Kineothrix alysoides TaxID=1469948 RepID=A0A4R1QUL8_9FIRM|nr:AAA family ATPase [Kineothrix alysoides]TCL57656.1 AAA domain-containing protein [Kineothrix alysoides]